MAAWASAGLLTLSSGFHNRFFNLAGTVDSGVGAQVPYPNRVSPVIYFSGTYGSPVPQRLLRPRGHTPTSAPTTMAPKITDPGLEKWGIRRMLMDLILELDFICANGWVT